MTPTDAAETSREELRQLTVKLQTLGVQDLPVDDARTLALRSEPSPEPSSVHELVGRLPRLNFEGRDGQPPELQTRGLLGKGGMGVVELATQRSVGRDVAVKSVRPDARSDESTLVLLREGWATGGLEHPNIIPIYSMGRAEDGEPRIIMKKVSGTSWQQILDDPDRGPKNLDTGDPLALHIDILIQVTNALDYAHSRGVIHRDLKPENVMLGDFGEVYVLDWGIAVSVGEEGLPRLAKASNITSPEGTPAYMAPEMVDPEPGAIGPWTDVFLVGAILYEILTGRPPNRGQTVHQIMLDAYRCQPPAFDDALPAGLIAICEKAMARDRKERFQTIAQLRDALRQYRRRRRAYELAARGDRALQQVLEICDAEGRGRSIDDGELSNHFGRCRFAYEQALEIDPHNEAALEGLQRGLELMARRALEANAYRAASVLILDLPRENPELRARLDELSRRLDERRQDIEALERLERAVDPEVGRRSRTIMVVIIGVAITALSAVIGFIAEPTFLELNYASKFGYQITLVTFIGAVVYFGRGRFFDNRVNRQLMIGVWAIFVVTLTQNIFALAMDAPIHGTVATESLLYAGGATLMAIFFDKRVIWPALPFYALAITSSIWSDYAIQMTPVANALAFFAIAYLWWPGDEKNRI